MIRSCHNSAKFIEAESAAGRQSTALYNKQAWPRPPPNMSGFMFTWSCIHKLLAEKCSLHYTVLLELLRVKIITWERSCLEARVNETSDFDLKSAKYPYDRFVISQVKPAVFFVLYTSLVPVAIMTVKG